MQEELKIKAVVDAYVLVNNYKQLAAALAECLQEHHNRSDNGGFYSETELCLRTIDTLQKYKQATEA